MQEHPPQITNGRKMCRAILLIHLHHNRPNLGKCGYRDTSPNLDFLQAHLSKSRLPLALATQS